jgi:hypothetical protein
MLAAGKCVRHALKSLNLTKLTWARARAQMTFLTILQSEEHETNTGLRT